MPIYIKSNSTWKQANKIFVKQNSAWKSAQKVFIKQNSVWKLAYSDAVTINIDANQTNFNLYSYLGNPTTASTFNVVIGPNKTIISTAISIPAFDTGPMPAGSIVNLTVSAGSVIAGCGGRGEIPSLCYSLVPNGGVFPNPLTADPQYAAFGGEWLPAEDGGPAVYFRCAGSIVNNGTIGGGGGGSVSGCLAEYGGHRIPGDRCVSMYEQGWARYKVFSGFNIFQNGIRSYAFGSNVCVANFRNAAFPGQNPNVSSAVNAYIALVCGNSGANAPAENRLNLNADWNAPSTAGKRFSSELFQGNSSGSAIIFRRVKNEVPPTITTGQPGKAYPFTPNPNNEILYDSAWYSELRGNSLLYYQLAHDSNASQSKYNTAYRSRASTFPAEGSVVCYDYQGLSSFDTAVACYDGASGYTERGGNLGEQGYCPVLQLDRRYNQNVSINFDKNGYNILCQTYSRTGIRFITAGLAGKGLVSNGYSVPCSGNAILGGIV